MAKKKRIALVFGGQSSEHEVSRVSAESVLRNINRDKYDVVTIGITKDGRWLTYDGPPELIGSGEWQSVAERKLICPGGESNDKVLTRQKHDDRISDKAKCDDQASTGESIAISGYSARSILRSAGAEGEQGSIDVVFPVLHGNNGEDGTIQGLFELAGVPYIGSGVLGSALGMDKAYAKIVFEKEGLPQGKYLAFSRKQTRQQMDFVIEQTENLLSYPCFVKPSNSGSSVGVTKAHGRDELVGGLLKAAKYDRRILVEEFINGREIECSVLGNDEPAASTVGEIIPCNEFYDYDAKYDAESTSKAVIPADLPERTIAEIRDCAVKAFKALDCSGLARVDFFVEKVTGKVYINEINTIPGFTSISMYPKLWEASGISYPELIEKLIDLAIERYEDSRREI